MKVLLISYGDFDYDGRLRELYKVFAEMGDLYAITRGACAQNAHHKVYNGSYFSFIKEAVAFGKQLQSVDLLVLDNRKSVIPGLLLAKHLQPKIVIQDCRELYLPKEVTHLAGKIGCAIEKRGIQRADILICANQDRANYMKDIFHLTQTPIVYENLRELAYSSEDARVAAEAKFAQYIVADEIRLISTSGCSVSRTNDVLVAHLNKVNSKCRLFLVGNNTAADEAAIRQIIADKKLNNVEILGQLNQDELKYLISASHIGIVNYHQKDVNNKYCASGKIFEFLYEGLPVVTTTNPPLKRLCDEAHIGCADDLYYTAINQVVEHMDAYRDSVAAYAAAHPVAANNTQLSQELLQRISSLLAENNE